MTGKTFYRTANDREEARFNIVARGLWQTYVTTFFDVTVLNPFAKTYKSTKINAAFNLNEKQEKNSSNILISKFSRNILVQKDSWKAKTKR